jgi:hypothetical protein
MVLLITQYRLFGGLWKLLFKKEKKGMGRPRFQKIIFISVDINFNIKENNVLKTIFAFVKR